jgi:hypothetical protein
VKCRYVSLKNTIRLYKPYRYFHEKWKKSHAPLVIIFYSVCKLDLYCTSINYILRVNFRISMYVRICHAWFSLVPLSVRNPHRWPAGKSLPGDSLIIEWVLQFIHGSCHHLTRSKQSPFPTIQALFQSAWAISLLIMCGVP